MYNARKHIHAHACARCILKYIRVSFNKKIAWLTCACEWPQRHGPPIVMWGRGVASAARVDRSLSLFLTPTECTDRLKDLELMRTIPQGRLGQPGRCLTDSDSEFYLPWVQVASFCGGGASQMYAGSRDGQEISETIDALCTIE